MSHQEEGGIKRAGTQIKEIEIKLVLVPMLFVVLRVWGLLFRILEVVDFAEHQEDDAFTASYEW